MSASVTQQDRVVLGVVCALAVVVGIWTSSAAFGVFLAVAVVASLLIGKRVGGGRRSTQALTGLVLLCGLCAATALVGVLILMLMFAVGGGVGGPID